LKDKVWKFNIWIKSPLKEMIRAEAKDSGMTYVEVIRNRLRHSYKMDKQKAGIETDNLKE